MEWQKIDEFGYTFFGRGYLYLNVFLDVLDFCKESVLGPADRKRALADDEEWSDFLEWRNRQEQNSYPLDF